MNPENQNRASGKTSQDQELADLNQLKILLRQTMTPVSSNLLDPHADLWPHLRARIESHQQADRIANSGRAPSRIPTRVHWFDWALAALATAALVFFPAIIPALLYHF